MRKLIFLFLLLLIATPCFGQDMARMSLGVMGSQVPVAGSSCTTVADSETTNADYCGGWVQHYIAGSFTTTSAYTLCKVTVKLGYTTEAPATSLLSAEIWSDNAGTPNAVLANGASNNTIDAAGLPACASRSDQTWTFATGPSLSDATKYWIVIRRPGDISKGGICMGEHSHAGQTNKYSDDGASWTSGDANYYIYFINYK
jgi:hypothetical protein